MRKLLFSGLGLTALLAVMSAPALAFPAASAPLAGQSASPVVLAQYYYWHHHHYHHRRWYHHHWSYYN